MTCPCCLPQCCPAFRAFDGSNTFYRYLMQFDWDVPVDQAVQFLYQIQPGDGDTAIDPRRGEDGQLVLAPYPTPRYVDGHAVWDATAGCVGYSTATGDVGSPWWTPGYYGHRFNINGLGSGPTWPLATSPTQSKPWRLPNLFKGSVGYDTDTRVTTELMDRWVPTANEPDFYTEIPNDSLPGDGTFFLFQRRGTKSLMRKELRGQYASRPSPYCYMNPNPLP